MRVGIIALLHESNTFIGRPTTLSHFQQNMLLSGSAIGERMKDSHHEIGGFFAGLGENQLDAIPIFAARAMPYGTIAAEAFDELVTRMLTALEHAGALDGLLVAPHGATVAANHPDADGFWLRTLRQHVGDAMPIIGTLDAHANLSPRMVKACDALIAYRSNPHLDQRERGREAASLMARTLREEIRPTMAAAFPPVVINIERQMTGEPQCRRLYDVADAMLERPGVLSNSILLGFPYADVIEMGSSVIVVTDNDRQQADRLASDLATDLWMHRTDFIGQMIEVEAALDMAVQAKGPVCLLDMGDNVGGGSPADGTFLAHALATRRIGPAFVCLYDPEAVAQASAAGTGTPIRLSVGAKTDDQHGPPFTADFTVISLHDGSFSEPQPRHGGLTHCDQGPTAILRTGEDLTVMLTSHRMPPFSIRQLTSCGLDPAAFHVLVAKGVNAPVAAYAPVCTRLIRVNTPGVTTADVGLLDFQHRRRPLFPFEMDTEWKLQG